MTQNDLSESGATQSRPDGNGQRSRIAVEARRGTLVTVVPADRKLDEFTTGNHT